MSGLLPNMLPAYGGQRPDCISRLRDIPAEDDPTPPRHVLAHELRARPRRTGIVADPRGLAKERSSEAVARRGGCPSRARRPVAGTDHSARDGYLEASSPGLERDTHPSLQARFVLGRL